MCVVCDFERGGGEENPKIVLAKGTDAIVPKARGNFIGFGYQMGGAHLANHLSAAKDLTRITHQLRYKFCDKIS